MDQLFPKIRDSTLQPSESMKEVKVEFKIPLVKSKIANEIQAECIIKFKKPLGVKRDVGQ